MNHHPTNSALFNNSSKYNLQVTKAYTWHPAQPRSKLHRHSFPSRATRHLYRASHREYARDLNEQRHFTRNSSTSHAVKHVRNEMPLKLMSPQRVPLPSWRLFFRAETRHCVDLAPVRLLTRRFCSSVLLRHTPSSLLPTHANSSSVSAPTHSRPKSPTVPGLLGHGHPRLNFHPISLMTGTHTSTRRAREDTFQAGRQLTVLTSTFKPPQLQSF